MSWPVIYRGFGIPEDVEGWGAIGDLYALDKTGWGPGCSKRYHAVDALVRPPLLLVMPRLDHLMATDSQTGERIPVPPRPGFEGQPFCIDSAPTSNPDSDWAPVVPWPLVVGEPALITLTPSVNMVGSYHGFVQNGVITDDCEGRRPA